MPKLILYVGPMYASKSSNILLRLERQRIWRKRKVLCLQPKEDTRQPGEIRWRGVDAEGNPFTIMSVPAFTVSNPQDVTELVAEHNPEIMVIDELQFFGGWIVKFLKRYLFDPKAQISEILAAGLDLDARGQPFGPVWDIAPYADEIYKLSAVCHACGSEEGVMTQMLTTVSDDIIRPGDTETYEARCRRCWTPPTEK